MIKRKHPSDRAERRRLKTLKEPGVRLRDIVSPEFIKDHGNARHPIEAELLEAAAEETLTKPD